jgi:hypothetical protein
LTLLGPRELCPSKVCAAYGRVRTPNIAGAVLTSPLYIIIYIYIFVENIANITINQALRGRTRENMEMLHDITNTSKKERYYYADICHEQSKGQISAC